MGMKCKKCNEDLTVRGMKYIDPHTIRRKKICPKCKEFIYTVEMDAEVYNDMANFYNGLMNMINKNAAKHTGTEK